MTNSNDNDIKLMKSMHAVFSDMQESISGEVTAIRSQTDQVGSLLEDAIASLHDAFGSIHSTSEEQIKAMSSLMTQVVGGDDGENIFQKAEHASGILAGLVDTLLLSSKNNLHALTTMDGTKRRLIKMKNLCQEQGDIGAQLLACCEGGAPDVAMVRDLAKQLQEREQQQLAYATETMQTFMETHRLIDEISSKDMEDVFASKTKVETILKHFFQINDIVSSTRSSVSQVNAEIRKHLGSAIRALQFEDISRQSLGHTMRHLDRMEGMVAILTDGLDDLNQDSLSLNDYVVKVAAIHAAMVSYHQALQLEDVNPVSQESMDEGDVDLF